MHIYRPHYFSQLAYPLSEQRTSTTSEEQSVHMSGETHAQYTPANRARYYPSDSLLRLRCLRPVASVASVAMVVANGVTDFSLRRIAR